MLHVWNGDVLAMDEQDVRMFVLLCIGFFEGVVGRCLVQKL